MSYQISRNGQMYGPYTFEDLQRYVASGNILATDMAKSETMTDWIPVSQILAGASVPPQPGYQTPSAYSAPSFGAPSYAAPSFGGLTPQPQYNSGANQYPDAPDLHWGLVLLFTVISCGLFAYVWILIQNAWLKRVQPNSKSLMFFIFYMVANVFSIILTVAAASNGESSGVGSLISLVGFILLIVASFSEKASLEEHFNSVEPMGLQLNGVMVFFFNFLYFQYHHNRIKEIKRAARYAGAPRPY
jgi:uncharacterized membrane protein